MEIEKLTPEQVKELEKIYKKFFWSIATVSLSYFGFLFFANFSIIVIDAIYMHDAGFRTIMAIGTALIGMLGLHKEISTRHDKLSIDVKKIVNTDK